MRGRRRRPRDRRALRGHVDSALSQADGGRAIPRRLTAGLVVAAALLGGCGAESADLFEVKRSGADPNANVDLVVNDGGTASCNGGEARALQGDGLLDARDLARRLESQAALSIELPPGPGSTLRYVVRLPNGRVAFSDTSAGKPHVFDELVAFSKDVIEDLCKIER